MDHFTPPMVTREILQYLLVEGETESVEFKQKLNNVKVAVQLIAGMANSNGGVIFVGVDDNGNPIGLSEEALILSRTAVRRAADSLFPDHIPSGYLSTREIRLQEGAILAIQVPALPDQMKPLRTADGSVYVRRGTETHKEASSPPPESASKLSEREVGIFVAMSFQVEREPALVDYYEAMKRAIQRTGLRCHVNRVDEVEGDYEITAQIEKMITTADIVIADFTLNSPNVYYEAGIARGANVYTIRTARKDTDIPFDVGTKKFILYANATQLEEALIEPLQKASVEAQKRHPN
ncbi:helix-turn-helix domain-containing protein [Streptomyces sp. NPDC001698]|uniref:AlbA family DNA-binding domain-containing protein n=1 Tax=Streptomyces sp. NPDC001698 TaxID=3364601 RepID=UPI0036902B73